MRINRQIDFKKEAIDLIYKIYLNNNLDENFLNEIQEHGVNKNDLTSLYTNYYKLKSNFQKELIVPDKLIPFFTISFMSSSILSRLYVMHKNTDRVEYKTFINRFFEGDLAFKESYSDNLEFSDILNIINGLDINDKDKLSLVNLYTGGEGLFNEIVECVDKAAKIFERYFSYVEEEVEEIYKELLDKKTLTNIFQDYFNDKDILIDSTSEINISVINYNYVMHKIFDNTRYIYVGYLILKLSNLIKENNNDEEDALSVFKSISDPTRYKILKILSSKQTYGNDIANILGLSAATINHHLNILVNNYLLKMIIDPQDNKKIYYEINKKRIDKVINILRSNLL